jgi:hypothetical protein
MHPVTQAIIYDLIENSFVPGKRVQAIIDKHVSALQTEAGKLRAWSTSALKLLTELRTDAEKAVSPAARQFNYAAIVALVKAAKTV